MALDVSTMPKLGFGLMRLPTIDGEIEVPRLCAMVDASMEAGFNYFDTAYVYHDGHSEEVVRTVLTERYPRESFLFATKLPAWKLQTLEDRDRIFEEELRRTGLDYVDNYLLHSVEDGNIATYDAMDCWRWALDKKAEGKIRHFGFSFHGSPALLEDVLDNHPEVEFVQIQLNYADWENPVVESGRLYEILRAREMPIIVMEPVKGGLLADLTPDQEAPLKAARPGDSPARWALRFAGSLPGVATILSGMSNEEQMADNVATFTDFEPLSDAELALVEEVRRKIMDVDQIPCTTCRYCTADCPMGIAIPDVFRAMNTYRLYGQEFRPKAFYKSLVNAGQTARANTCIACGQCEGVCPQHLPIIRLLEEASALLDA